MLKRTMTAVGVAGLAVGLLATTAAAQEQDKKVNSPTAVHEQAVKHLKAAQKVLGRLGTPETAFDFIHPAVSGPVVVLEGFTSNNALKDDAQAQVQKLDWVVHVVNEIEWLDVGPELRRMRRQILGILEKQVPQAFPENHANIRIKVTVKGDVTLVGLISPNDKLRYEAAVEQIKHVPLVKSVTDSVVHTTK